MSSQDEDVYRPPASRIAVVEQAVHELEPATRWSRFAAAFVDGALMWGLIVSIAFLIGRWDEYLSMLRGESADGFLQQVFWAAVGFAMFLILHGYPLAMWGQTWGKRLLGIRIVDMQGRHVSFVHLLTMRYGIRDLTFFALSFVPVSFLLPLANLLNLMLIFGEERRCGHDLIAGTQVIRVRTPASLQAASRP